MYYKKNNLLKMIVLTVMLIALCCAGLVACAQDTTAACVYSSTDYTVTLEPTCQVEGVKNANCVHDDCDKFNPVGEPISIVGHAYDAANLDVIIQSTCIATGIMHGVCIYEDCNETQEHIMPMADHKYSETDFHTIQEPTCITVGIKQAKCLTENCIAIDSNETIIPMTGVHNFSTTEFTTTLEPTCTAKGLKNANCLTENCVETNNIGVDIDMVAHILNNQGHCAICDSKGEYIRDGKTIWFGSYPQTIKAAGVTVGSVLGTDGYYTGSDGHKYAKVDAVPFDDKHNFSNNTLIVKNTTYYFKVEPIKWTIIDEDGESALLTCDIIIDSQLNGSSSNAWETSEIRAWLAGDFYNNAFSILEKELLKAVTHMEAPNTAVTDSVFLLSRADIENVNYFEVPAIEDDPSDSRAKKVSDFGKSNGLRSSSTHHAGYWWSRSPVGKYSYYVHADGATGNTTKSYTWIGIAPSIRIIL